MIPKSWVISMYKPINLFYPFLTKFFQKKVKKIKVAYFCEKMIVVPLKFVYL